jgi:hypothetical protein
MKCIVMPTMNSAVYLAECLESLHATADSTSHSIPILILDGGSLDATPLIAEDYSKRYKRVIFHSMPSSHPAARLNQIIRSREFRYAMICHSDDVYNLSVRMQVLEEMISLKHVLRGSQVKYFQSPLEYVREISSATPPYFNSKLKYPCEPLEIISQMAYWWCFSLNSVNLDLESIAKLGIYYDWRKYSYCADYYFAWRLSCTGRISNSTLVSVFTRQSSDSDGALNEASVGTEIHDIRKQILSELIPVSIRNAIDISPLLDVEFRHQNLCLGQAKFHYRKVYQLSRRLARYHYEFEGASMPLSQVAMVALRQYSVDFAIFNLLLQSTKMRKTIKSLYGKVISMLIG